jgi:hybrid polyketide synthase/nonribosomal peptide synthetase ACE1
MTIKCIPFSSQSAKDDKGVFSTTIWDVANPDAEKVAQDFAVTTEQRALAHLLERVSIFYLRNLEKTVPNNHFSRSKGPPSYLFKFASHCISLADKGKLPFWKAEWDYDTYEQISLACESYADVIDIKLLRRFGDNLVAIATGEKKAIEVGTRDNLLAEFYQDSLGMDTYTRFLAKTVRQIVHRYPHLNVLEIGAGTGGATKAIFQEIGQAYASYTFTDVSSGFFPMSQKVFEPQHGMAFKVLNINNDPRTQGFEGQPYDLIIASMVLHATEYLEGTLRNVRRLLKPGGYLVLLEGLPDTNVRYGTIFGAFPGWWAGSKHERVLSPLVSIADWHELLCKTGFSGVDSATPNPEPLVAPLTAIVSQAVDDRILLLRDPLSSQQQLFATQNLVEDLIIVGGSSPHMSKATDQIEGVLRQYYGRLTKVPSFTAISTVDMSDRTTILALNELDGPFFKSLDESSWEALRETLARAKTILWVTHSRLSESPHGNMIIGLLRTASREIPTLDVQSLDFADYRKVNHHIIAETLLRLEVATLWKRKYPQEDLLFSVESEIVLNDKQQAKIPRLMINQKMNQRYNSSRRPVSMSVSKDDQAISVAYEDSRYFLQQRQSLVSDRRTGVLNVTHSLLSALKVAESGYMFLKLGKKCDSGDLTVFLSTEFSSVTNAWDNFEIPIEIEPDLEANFLSHVAHHLLISLVLKGLTKGKRVLVLEGGLEYMSVMKWRARNIDVDVTFMTYNTKSIDPNCLVVHPNAAERDLRSLLPRDVSVFVDFTGPGSDQMRGDRIRSQLPAHCRCERSGTLFSKVSCIPWTSHSNEIRTRLQDAVNYAYYSLSEKELPRLGVPTTGVGSLSECGNELSPQSIIDWTTSQKLSVQVQSVNTQMAFSECNTYWLVGLTHGLGLSLAEWMVRHGAKYIVLSSRRPIVDESWLAKMFAAGAVIKIFKWWAYPIFLVQCNFVPIEIMN